MAQCRKCGVEKDAHEFYDHPYNKSGKSGACKACTCAYQKARNKERRMVRWMRLIRADAGNKRDRAIGHIQRWLDAERRAEEESNAGPVQRR